MGHMKAAVTVLITVGIVVAVAAANVTREQAAAFQRDKERSHRVTLDEWENRPWTEKLKERAAGHFDAASPTRIATPPAPAANPGGAV